MTYLIRDKLFILKITLINTSIALFIFRASIPPFKYPFILLFPILSLYLLYTSRNVLITKINGYLRVYAVPLLLMIIIAIHFFLSGKLYLEVFKDLSNTGFILLFFFLVHLVIDTQQELHNYQSNMISVIIVFAVIISLYGILSLLNIIPASWLNILDYISPLSDIDQINVDYNFALLPVFFGLIAILYFLVFRRNSAFITTIYILMLSIFSFYIAFSGSRRGFFMLIMVYSLLFLIVGFLLLKKHLKKEPLAIHLNPVIYLFLFQTAIAYLFVFQFSSESKTRILEVMNSRNILNVKATMSRGLQRSISPLIKNVTYGNIYDFLWSADLDPREPDKSWGTRIHKTVFPLTGENVEIVPEGAKGYLMDSTCDASSWSGNAYSYTLFWNPEATEKDTLSASAYCFVSQDFNGDYVRIAIDGISYEGNHGYDLAHKGTWQKLSIPVAKGKSLLYLYFCKYGTSDFTGLRGYVVFAFPQLEIISHERSIPYLAYSYDNTRFLSSLLPSLSFSGNFSSHNYLNISENRQGYDEDNDPVRRWIAKFISQDTVYYPYKTNIQIDTISNDFFDLRFIRWQFAIQLYLKEYGIGEKLFGGGFDFLNWYGHYFLGDNNKTDYPHNPFLHVLLYSGVIGLLIYCLLIVKTILYYLKYLSDYYLFSIFFLITLFFTFFSSGTPFDPPIMGFFLCLPFLNRFIYSD